MREIPIEVLLTFPIPNYENPDTQGLSLIVINCVFAGLVVAVVALRLYTRFFIKKWLGSDDIAIILATIFTLALNAVVIVANMLFYWDRHIWDIPLDKIAQTGKIAMAAKGLFAAAGFFTRLSLLLFYYRLTADTGLVKYKWAIHGAMAFNLAVFIAFVPITVFQCTPVSAYWEYPPTGKCLDEGKATLAAGIITCFADLMVTILPIPMIMRLKMPLKQRLGVVVLLGLGLIVTIAGVVRTYCEFCLDKLRCSSLACKSPDVSVTTKALPSDIWKALISSYDMTWYAYPLWICAAVEIDLAVLCACAPPLRPLIARFARPIMTSISNKYGSGSRTGRSTGLGGTSPSVTNGLTGNTAIDSTVDHELDKLEVALDAQEYPQLSNTNASKKKRSKTWRKGGNDDLEAIETSPTKLLIMESQSFEVRHETRQQAGVPPQDPYMRLDESALELREQWKGNDRLPKEKLFGHKHSISSPRSHRGVSDRPPKVKTPQPLSPFASSFNDDQAMLSIHGQLERDVSRSPVDDTFYLSGSQEGGTSTASVQSGEWPLNSVLKPATPKTKDGERRWDIENNPFRENSREGESEGVSRPATSGAIPDRGRWGSNADVWEEIHSENGNGSLHRSNSLIDRSKGDAWKP